MEKYPSLHDRIWQVGGERIAENELRITPPYDQWKLDQLKSLVKKGIIMPKQDYDPEAVKEKVVILLSGTATADAEGKKISGPSMLEAQAYKFDKKAILFVC